MRIRRSRCAGVDSVCQTLNTGCRARLDHSLQAGCPAEFFSAGFQNTNSFASYAQLIHKRARLCPSAYSSKMLGKQNLPNLLPSKRRFLSGILKGFRSDRRIALKAPSTDSKVKLTHELCEPAVLTLHIKQMIQHLGPFCRNSDVR
jgi:hypothetical protein